MSDYLLAGQPRKHTSVQRDRDSDCGVEDRGETARAVDLLCNDRGNIGNTSKFTLRYFAKGACS
jgi:hypothetical protein